MRCRKSFILGRGDLMASRTRAVKNASEKLSVFRIWQSFERDIRGIGRDFPRYLELDRLRFFVDGLELV